MRRSILKRLNIWTFKDWLVQIPFLLGKKSRSNAPPVSTKIPLSPQRQISPSIKDFTRAFHIKICRNDIFKLLLKTLLKELSSNKGEIYLVNPSNPEKTEKTHGRITSEQELNLVQIPHPSKAMFKFPSPRARCTVKCPGCARGRLLKFRIDRRLTGRFVPHWLFIIWYPTCPCEEYII